MQFHDFIELGIKAIFVMHKLLPNLSTYIHNMAYVSDCMRKCVGVSLRHSVSPWLLVQQLVCRGYSKVSDCRERGTIFDIWL